MRFKACFKLFILSALLLAATRCACPGIENCAPDEACAVSDLLYFGTVRPGGVVTPEEWAEFLKNFVTPRFPKGFTVWRASGQWKGADGNIMQEDSFVLHIVHPGGKPNDEAIRSLIRAYKSQFGQESVLRVRSRACTSF